MKKITSSLVFILIFALYATFRTNASATPIITNTKSQAPTLSPVVIYNAESRKTVTPIIRKTLAVKTTAKKVHTSTMPSASVHHARPVRVGRYTDGTYTGRLADAYYETFKVRIRIKNGFIVDAYPLPYQQYNSTSQYINNYAMPRLRSEALVVQNANVNTISGATETSGAFRASLASALRKAA